MRAGSTNEVPRVMAPFQQDGKEVPEFCIEEPERFLQLEPGCSIEDVV